MTRRGGWKRTGARRPFRYLDARGNRIVDPDKLARIESLVIPPAWSDVWITPSPRGKLQATGMDAAGRRQYLYHPRFRAAQEEAKFDMLIRFAEKLPELRAAMARDMEIGPFDRDWVSAIAVRLINLGWFRIGSERYVKTSRTFGITTITRRHVHIRGSRLQFQYRGKHKVLVRRMIVDPELAEAVSRLLSLPGSHRVFRYELDGQVHNLTAAKLNGYIRQNMGPEFTAKDFRTWGGTLLAAIAFAEAGPAQSAADAKRKTAAVMRRVAEHLGNTPAVARASYVSPAVVEQYLDGRTIEDFRPRHLRIVGARDVGLDPEELAVLSLLRSWRIRRSRRAA